MKSNQNGAAIPDMLVICDVVMALLAVMDLIK